MRIARVLGAAAVAVGLLVSCGEDACRGVASYGVDEKGESFSSCDESTDEPPAAPSSK